MVHSVAVLRRWVLNTLGPRVNTAVSLRRILHYTTSQDKANLETSVYKKRAPSMLAALYILSLISYLLSLISYLVSYYG